MTASSRQISPQAISPLPEPVNASSDQLAPNQVPPLTGYNLFLSDRTLAPLTGRLAGLRGWRAMRAERAGERREVRLAPARSGWLGALCESDATTFG